jgi:hypothetical protein
VNNALLIFPGCQRIDRGHGNISAKQIGNPRLSFGHISAGKHATQMSAQMNFSWEKGMVLLEHSPTQNQPRKKQENPMRWRKKQEQPKPWQKKQVEPKPWQKKQVESKPWHKGRKNKELN